MGTPQENIHLARRWFDEVRSQRRTQTVHELQSPDSVVEGWDAWNVGGLMHQLGGTA